MFLTEAKFKAAILRYFGLTEALRSDQSHEQLRIDLGVALNEWPDRPGARDGNTRLGVAWVFDDRMIAYQWSPEANASSLWEIPWQRAGETGAGFSFGAPVEVVEISLFEPVAESRRPGSVRMTESIEGAIAPAPVQESRDTGSLRIRAIGMTADRVNGNGRRYPRAVLAGAVEHLNKHLHESAGQGRLVATGEVEHPSDKGQRPSLLETVIKWEAASLDASGKVLLEGAILPTSKGRDLATLVEHGVPVGISMRGYGTAKTITENAGGERQSVQEVQELWITGWDAVMEPSDTTARIVESQQASDDKHDSDGREPAGEKKAMNIEELLKLLGDKPELREALLNKLGLAEKAVLAEALGVKPDEIGKALEEGQKAKAELAQRQAQEAVNAEIAEATKGLKYGDALNGLFADSIRAAAPETPAAVKAIVEAKRKEYDSIAATGVLAGMGKQGVQVLGPVFERETGRPEFARAAWELNESLVRAGEGHRRDAVKGDSMAEIFTARVLERFDKQNQAKLLNESRMFEEAEQTSDLNLPYSVARMLIEQAYPELVAANVYDFGVTDSSQARVYYEAYAGESGASVTATDEVVVMSLANWVQLANKRIRPGTVVLTHTSGTPTYAEGTDYVVDYADGKVLALATITEAQSCKIDYVADAFRKGEMAEIERAKNTLTFTLLNMEADRLAMQISREAIVFSRSQLGYDAVTRTLGNLARLLRRSIDKGILYKGLAASLKQANNSGGTWTAGTDAESVLVKVLGIAKTKVYGRNYVPTAFIMSQTSADRLSNWDGFKRDGFPNAILNAAGFAGGLKGLPVFASTEYPDTYAQVVHRELVAHRVYQAMTFQGPFPSYSNGKLVGADQYYAEEFNGSMVTVEQKSAHIKIS